MPKKTAGRPEALSSEKILRDLLLAAASPDNLDAFLRRIIDTLHRQDALGAGTGLAVVLRPGRSAPPFTAAVNFTKEELACLLTPGRNRSKSRKGMLNVPVRGGPAKGSLLARLAAPASRTRALELLKIAARTINGRLEQEGREAQLTRERDVADAITHLEELYLAFPAISLEEISRTVLDEARRLTGSRFGFAGYINPATGWLTIPAITGEAWKSAPHTGKELVFKEFNGLWGWVLKKKKPLLTNSAASDPRSGGLPGGHIKIEKFAAAPAVSGKKLIGILALANPAGDYPAAAMDAVNKLSRVYALMLRHKLIEHKQADTAKQLAESELKYKKIFDKANAAIIIADAASGMILEANTDAEKLTGLTREELIGMNRQKLHPPEAAAHYKAQFREHGRKGLATFEEAEVVRKDGTRAQVEISTSRMKLGGREVLQGIFQDISKRRQAETLVQDIVGKNPMSIQIVDKDGHTLKVNSAHTRLFGCIPPPDYSVFKDPQLKAQGFARWFKRLRAGEVVHMPDTSYNAHHVDPKAPDVTVWLRTVIFPLKDSRGKPERFVIMHEDISGSRQAETAMRQSEEKYRRLVENLGKEYFFYRHDTEGIFDYLSPSITSALGYSTKEFLTHFSTYLTANPRNKEVLKHTALSLRGIQQPAYEVEIYHKNGSVHWLEVTETPLFGPDGKATGVEGLAHDITRRKQEAQALQESEARYKALFSGIGTGILVADADTKEFLYANPAMCRMFGYTERELTRLAVKDLHPKEALPHVISEFEAQARGEKILALDLPCLRKDGTVISANIHTVRLFLDGRNCLVGQFTDITESKRLHNILMGSEEKYRTLFETSRDALMILEPPNWKFSQANKATLKMFGAPEEADFLKLTPWAISPKKQPDGTVSIEKAKKMMKIALETGSNYFEWEHKCLYGPVFSAEVLLTRVDIGEKQVIQACVRDISARKRMEELLRQSELRQHLAMSQINGVLWVLDKTMRFTLSRGQGLAAMGLKPDQVKGMTLEEFMRPAGPDSPSLAAHHRALQGRNVSYEEKVNGIEFSIFLSPLRDQDDRITGVVGIGLDISEKKRMERLLKENEETLTKIFDTTTDAMFIKDSNGRFVMVNKAFADLFNKTPKEILGKCDKDLFPPELAAETASEDSEVVRTGKTLSFTRTRTLPTGNYYFNTVKTPMRDLQGGITGVLGISRDITALKKMESELALARAAETVSKMTRPMAHDFNNALAAINGYATLIDDDLAASSPIKTEISRIIEAVRRAAVLTSKLQDFARNPKIENPGETGEKK